MKKPTRSPVPGAEAGLKDPRELALLYSMMSLPPKAVNKVFHLHISAMRETLSPQEIVASMTLEGEAAKPMIEFRSGPAISSPEAAKRLGVSDETIRNRVKALKLIAYPESEKKLLRLPEWQFSTPNTPHPWVIPLLEAFGLNGWAIVDFLTVPRTGPVADVRFEGETLLQKLRAGETDLVLEAARRANPA